MKVRGDNAPANAFSLEEQPDKPGYCLVRFYENVAPFSETQGELTISSSTMSIIWNCHSMTGSMMIFSAASTAISRRRSWPKPKRRPFRS